MLAHGIRHIFGGGKIAGTGGWFESLGMKPGWLHAWTASLTEIGAGAMLVAGLLTPLACAGVVGVMVVALITNHWKNGYFIFYKGEGYEYVLTLTLAAMALAALGAGEWSLDNAIDLSWGNKTGLVIGVGAGVGGALALLAGFWRPEKKDDAAT
ncbi:MAG: putative oxidoreductase [Actinomycetota bacterium]